jgi:hypothetical protein
VKVIHTEKAILSLFICQALSIMPPPRAASRRRAGSAGHHPSLTMGNQTGWERRFKGPALRRAAASTQKRFGI